MAADDLLVGLLGRDVEGGLLGLATLCAASKSRARLTGMSPTSTPGLISPLSSHGRRSLEADRALPLHQRITDYGRENRIHLLNKLLCRAEEWIDQDRLLPQHFQIIAVGIAVAIDKRRLEDGEISQLTAVLTADQQAELVAMRRRAVEAARLLGLERNDVRPLGLPMDSDDKDDDKDDDHAKRAMIQAAARV